jgi:hypothetical protein
MSLQRITLIDGALFVWGGWQRVKCSTGRQTVGSKQFVENIRILILQVPSQLLYRATNLIAEWTAGIDQRLKIRNQPGQSNSSIG